MAVPAEAVPATEVSAPKAVLAEAIAPAEVSAA